MILETERLRLRPVKADDWSALYPIMSDPRVMAYWDSPEIAHPTVVRGILAEQAEAMERGKAWYWAVERQSDGLFLGSCDLSDIDRFHHRAEVGFIFAREAWGEGYGLESMSAVVTQAAALGLRRLWARTHVGNISSERLLQRLGFQAEGHLRGHIQRGGERRDCLVFGLLL